jgi:hypothetical protein
LPNLVGAERDAETRFANTYLDDPDKMVAEYNALQNKVVGEKNGQPKYAIGDGPHVFNADDAKVLSHDYHPRDKSPEEQLAAKALFNTAVHQTATAIAKRAFVKHLDSVKNLPPERQKVLVTAGSVAVGKGFSLKSNERGKEMAALAGAVWDATGEANSTENTWILDECRKRGLKCQFAYIHGNPEVGFDRMLSRAAGEGRTVDALPMADSYSIGPKNFHAFHQAHKDEAEFIFFDNSGPAPKEIDGVPPESLQADPGQVYAKLSAMVDAKAGELPPHVVRGATAGRRIWMEPEAAS